MKLTVYHAEHRCRACRDFHGLLARALIVFWDLHSIDASPFVEFIDIDKEPARKPKSLKTIPCLIWGDREEDNYCRHAPQTVEAIVELLETMAATPEEALAAQIIVDDYPFSSASGNIVFYRTYSRRKDDGNRETYQDTIDRCVPDLCKLGDLDSAQSALVQSQAEHLHAFPSGRWLWVGGTPWIQEAKNFSGAYNCTSTTLNSPDAFGLIMELAMMGAGTGAVLEQEVIAQLPRITRQLDLLSVSPVGSNSTGGRADTVQLLDDDGLTLLVGDSRQGWVDAYQSLINLAMEPGESMALTVDLSQVRPAGSPLKGFGGLANPVRLAGLFGRVVSILNKAVGRQLTPLEACLLIDEAASCVVAGNIRRSAGMRQFSSNDLEASSAKAGLYLQSTTGVWTVDPERETLRMANHTRCYHHNPTLEEVTAAVRLQYDSGEGAIQFVPEAIARANADLLFAPELKSSFLQSYEEGHGRDFLCSLLDVANPTQPKADKDRELDHRLSRYGLNPCGEIIGADFHCNLSEVHLNTLPPSNLEAQEDAFRAAALNAAALLCHDFIHERYTYSRELDPIVGVSFTGLFDFFVEAFGLPWLKWFVAGRPDQGSFADQEAQYLAHWRMVVEETVTDFCQARCLKTPNRCTTVQPAGTKSLLTGASPGWHPPKSQYFIRRITFGAHDPVAMAAIESGFSVVPSPSCRDEAGRLINDIDDPRVGEWLIEIPSAVNWAGVTGADEIDLSRISAVAQFDFYMQVQRHYTTHNTSATIELREGEIEPLAQAIHASIANGDGYISAALLARFDVEGGTFPRLPFEPISRERFLELQALKNGRYRRPFREALEAVDRADLELTPQDSACGAAACLAAIDRAEREGKS